MNLAHLYYFCKLAELQHYTKAAKELYITQPSLSGAISSLEAELGIALFEKSGRNVVLTKYGKEFYDTVSAALRTLDKGVAKAKEYGGGLSGTVNIGCIPTIQSDFIPQVLLAFRDLKGPAVKVNIFEAQTNEIIQRIRRGEWDVGFCTHVPDGSDLFFVPILCQLLAATVRRGHPLDGRKSLDFSDLSGHKLISYHLEQPIGRDIQKLLARHHLSADHHYGNEESMYGICQLSDYVAILLDTPRVRMFDDISLIPLAQVPIDFHMVYMVFHRDRYKTPVVESFIDYVAAFWSYQP